MPRSRAWFSAASASSSSLYMRKRLPLPKARMETRAPVLPRMRVGIPFELVVFGAAVAAAATAAAPRNSLRDTLMHTLLSHHLTPVAGVDAGGCISSHLTLTRPHPVLGFRGAVLKQSQARS